MDVQLKIWNKKVKDKYLINNFKRNLKKRKKEKEKREK